MKLTISMRRPSTPHDVQALPEPYVVAGVTRLGSTKGGGYLELTCSGSVHRVELTVAEIDVLSAPRLDRTQDATAPRPERIRDIGSRLRVARTRVGLSQAEVARRLRMLRPTISQLEAGGRRLLAEEVPRFAALYGCDPLYLLGEPR